MTIPHTTHTFPLPIHINVFILFESGQMHNKGRMMANSRPCRREGGFCCSCSAMLRGSTSSLRKSHHPQGLLHSTHFIDIYFLAYIREIHLEGVEFEKNLRTSHSSRPLCKALTRVRKHIVGSLEGNGRIIV